jgi:hypothetical protein
MVVEVLVVVVWLWIMGVVLRSWIWVVDVL